MQSYLRTTLTSFLRFPQCHTAVLTKLADVQGHWMTNQRNMSARPFQKLQSIDNLVIKKGATLPYISKLPNGAEMRVERITQENGEDAWKLLQSCIKQGEGYSSDELEPLDVFLHNAETEQNYFQIVDHGNNKIACMLALRRCPLSRSEKTVHFSFLVTVSPDYRNKGFGHQYFSLVGMDLGRSVMGHPGFLVGRSVLGRGCHAIQHAGFNIIGTLPNCSYLEGTGWRTDIMFSSLDKHVISDSLRKMAEPELPSLVVSDVVPTSLQSDKPPLTNFPPLAINECSLDVDVASSQDVWQVEEMIRQAAQKGEGFGLDEFNAKGHFNRALLYDSHVVTLKTKDDSIVAAAIFGPTKLSRAYNANQAGGYILVNEEYRGKGVGNAFTRYLLSQASKAGYTSILTDVYCSNMFGQKIANGNGFSITGSMPHCGYMKDQGFTDSSVHYLKVSV